MADLDSHSKNGGQGTSSGSRGPASSTLPSTQNHEAMIDGDGWAPACIGGPASNFYELDIFEEIPAPWAAVDGFIESSWQEDQVSDRTSFARVRSLW